MTRMIVLYCVLAALLLALNVESLSCSIGERPYPPSSCITLSTDTSTASSTPCTTSSLVTFQDTEQYNTLARYIELYQQDGSPYWTGYSYNASNILVDVNGVPPIAGSPVLEASNFGTTFSAPEADGSCILIGLDGSNGVRLFREVCSAQQRYICTQTIAAPSVSLSASNSSSVVTLTCMGTNIDGPVQWRRDGSIVTNTTLGVVINGNTLTVSSGGAISVSYDCLVSNRAGAIASRVFTVGLSTPSTAPTISGLSAPTAVQFGTSLTLNCSFSTVNTLARVEWLINGEVMESASLTSGNTDAMFTVESFTIDGVYQCRVYNENGDCSTESLFISGTAGIPGLVKTPVALPDSQSQIFISWLYPLDHNVLDPVLLHYEVHYSEGNIFNEASSTQRTNILPVLLNGKLSAEGVVETTLTGLSPGTAYTVTLRAVGPTSLSGKLDSDRALVSTFGTVPDFTVDDSLKVRRTLDNKTLFADWSDVKTMPPVGQVERYWVEYRDFGKDDSSNIAVLDSKYSYLVVSPVQDAQNYEVRVRIGVIVSREPIKYEYSPFTKWVLVQGVTNTVPPVPPTQPLLPAASIIAAAVVVPVLILALVVFVVVVGVLCVCVKNDKKENYSRREKLDSKEVELEPSQSDTI